MNVKKPNLTNSGVTRLLVLFLSLSLLLCGATSCKLKQKLANKKKAKIEREQNVVKSKSELKDILNDSGDMSSEEMLKEIERIKGLGLEDEDVDDLLRQAETKAKERKRFEEEIAKKKLEEQKANEQKALAPKAQMEEYFNQIANAGNVNQANTIINKALKLCSSDMADVLIIVYQSGDVVDYDEPTNIKKYLNYLKDKKSYDKKIKTVELDGNGKIKLLELVKK